MEYHATKLGSTGMPCCHSGQGPKLLQTEGYGCRCHPRPMGRSVYYWTCTRLHLTPVLLKRFCKDPPGFNTK